LFYGSVPWKAIEESMMMVFPFIETIHLERNEFFLPVHEDQLGSTVNTPYYLNKDKEYGSIIGFLSHS
jgi:hypothetical protein